MRAAWGGIDAVATASRERQLLLLLPRKEERRTLAGWGCHLLGGLGRPKVWRMCLAADGRLPLLQLKPPAVSQPRARGLHEWTPWVQCSPHGRGGLGHQPRVRLPCEWEQLLLPCEPPRAAVVVGTNTCGGLSSPNSTASAACRGKKTAVSRRQQPPLKRQTRLRESLSCPSDNSTVDERAVRAAPARRERLASARLTIAFHGRQSDKRRCSPSLSR